MKKILLGLAAMSTLAFSAIDLNTAADGTNVWETGNQGKIVVRGTLTSQIPVVRYVVYASEDGTYSATDDVLTLPEFVLATKASQGGFSDVVKKVYVKRVNAGRDNVENLIPEDVVSFKIDFARRGYSQLSSDWFTKGGGIRVGSAVDFPAVVLISKTELEAIVASEGFIVNTYGDIASGDTNYRPTRNLSINSTENGVLEFSTVNNSSVSINPMDSTNVAKVETLFAGGRTTTDLEILVKVN